DSPAATAATTRRSGVTPSMSSSASRKTSLSSTRTTSIGWPAMPFSIGPFDADKKGVVRLAALVHLDLDVRVGGADRLDGCVRLGGAVADEDGEDISARTEKPREDVAGDGLELVPRRDRLSLHQAEKLALVHVDVADLRGTGGSGNGACPDRVGRLPHVCEVVLERPGGVEGDQRAEPGLHAPRGDDAHVLRALLRRLLCRKHHVLRVRKEDDTLFL